MRPPRERPATPSPMRGPAPRRSVPGAAATALLLLPLVLHCESSANLPLSVLLEKYCEALSALYNVTGPYCNATTDQIGTCWPRATAGELVERPCPEFFNGIKYNTTRNAYRECMGNGTWASKINYSQCEPILDDKRKYALHYKIALIINYLGHCISIGALIVAFMLFLCLSFPWLLHLREMQEPVRETEGSLPRRVLGLDSMFWSHVLSLAGAICVHFCKVPPPACPAF